MIDLLSNFIGDLAIRVCLYALRQELGQSMGLLESPNWITRSRTFLYPRFIEDKSMFISHILVSCQIKCMLFYLLVFGKVPQLQGLLESPDWNTYITSQTFFHLETQNGLFEVVICLSGIT